MQGIVERAWASFRKFINSGFNDQRQWSIKILHWRWSLNPLSRSSGNWHTHAHHENWRDATWRNSISIPCTCTRTWILDKACLNTAAGELKFGQRLFTTHPHVSDYILLKTRMGDENRWQIELLQRFGVYMHLLQRVSGRIRAVLVVKLLRFNMSRSVTDSTEFVNNYARMHVCTQCTTTWSLQWFFDCILCNHPHGPNCWRSTSPWWAVPSKYSPPYIPALCVWTAPTWSEKFESFMGQGD